MAEAEGCVTVHHPTGLHARPAALFVRTAAGFDATIRVTNLSRDTQREADAKSIISMMTLGVEQGHELRVRADGDDANGAVAALVALITGDFSERPNPDATAPGG